MAFSVATKMLFLVLVLVYISISGDAYDEDVHQAGTGVSGYDPFTGTGVVGNVPQAGAGAGAVPQTGAGAGAGNVPQAGAGAGAGAMPQAGAGIVDDDPAQLVAKALLCFNDKHIYSSCEESYRLKQSGSLHVPPEDVDLYCNGACLAESYLVLNCLENIMTHFLFYNKATIQDIRDTIKAGCGHGPERGDFNVAEHLQAEENSAYKTAIEILVGLAFAIMAKALFI